jgi:deoxyribonuclease V
VYKRQPYEPGALYKRELPCIQAVLELGPRLDLLIVDGYATLDPTGRPGLGARAAEAIGIAVIGVAKTPFRAATHAAEVIRGTAKRPLYVTTTGEFTAAEAAKIVAGMAGPHRLPMALSRVDSLARGRVLPISNDEHLGRELKHTSSDHSSVQAREYVDRTGSTETP